MALSGAGAVSYLQTCSDRVDLLGGAQQARPLLLPDLHPCRPSVLLQAEAAAAAEADAGPGDDADWFLAEVETGVAMVDVQPDVLREQLEQLFPMMAE